MADDQRGRVRSARTALGAAAVATAIVFAGCSGDDGTAETPPTTVEANSRLAELLAAAGLPDPATATFDAPTDGETVRWLTTQGAPAVAMVTASQALWLTGAGACETVAGELDAIAAPAAVYDAAAATPDAQTGEVLVGVISTIGAVLEACPDGGDVFDEALGEFAWQWAIADRRLNEIGVAR